MADELAVVAFGLNYAGGAPEQHLHAARQGLRLRQISRILLDRFSVKLVEDRMEALEVQ